jgi:pimeloyl-ACP methyl ester carboxylesterase
MQQKRVAGDGVELAVFEQGPEDAPAIVLLHGYPDTHAVWDPVVRILEKKFRVITYDVRGAGASTSDGRFGFEQLVADLRAVIGDRRVHLVGHDWGSIQGWEAAADRSLPIARFTSISGPCLDHVGHLMRRVGPRFLGQAARSWYVGAFHLPTARPMIRWGFERSWRWVQRHEGFDAYVPDTDDALRGVELYRANMIPRLFHPQERTVEIPVHLIVPAGDLWVRPILYEGLERWVRDLTRHDVPGGHWIQRTDPERVAELIARVD